MDDLVVDERIQLKWILNRMGGYGLDWLRVRTALGFHKIPGIS